MHQTLHIGEEIRQQLVAQERSVTWLAGKVNYDPSNLCKQLKSRHIHAELLYRISTVLGVDFFAHYSQNLSENLHGKNH